MPKSSRLLGDRALRFPLPSCQTSGARNGSKRAEPVSLSANSHNSSMAIGSAAIWGGVLRLGGWHAGVVSLGGRGDVLSFSALHNRCARCSGDRSHNGFRPERIPCRGTDHRGIRLAPSRPIISGILLGLLTYKPQLGLLVPIALIAAGHWRAVGVACATATGLAIISALAFGWSVWPAWIAMLPEYQAAFDSGNVHRLHFMPTVLSNMKMAGFLSPVVEGAQAISSVIVAVLVGRCFYRNAGRLAAASLFVGTLLVTPHAFIYDMPMILAAMALFIEEHRQRNATFSLASILVLSLAMLFPLMMVLQYPDAPVSSLSLLMLFGIILRHESPYVVTGLVSRLGVKAMRPIPIKTAIS